MAWEVLRSRNLQVDVTPQTDDVDLAWAAGIIEGEGSFHGVGNFQIQVHQKDPWLLHRLQELFGGSVSKYSQHSKSINPGGVIYGWHISGGRARGLATAIESYLSPRRQSQLANARIIKPFRKRT